MYKVNGTVIPAFQTFLAAVQVADGLAVGFQRKFTVTDTDQGLVIYETAETDDKDEPIYLGEPCDCDECGLREALITAGGFGGPIVGVFSHS